MDEEFHFRFKLVFLGDKATGKTSLIDSLTISYGDIVENDSSDELSIKSVNFVESSNIYNIQYWEIPSYMKNTDYFFRFCLGSTAIVYLTDLSKDINFENLSKWVTETNKCNIPIRILVGNKLDLYENSTNKKEIISFWRVWNLGNNHVKYIFKYMLALAGVIRAGFKIF